METRRTWQRIAQLRERRWSEADARVVLAEWRRSGLTLNAFAREHNLTNQRLWWWRSRLGEMVHETRVEEVALAPVVVTGSLQSRAPAVVRIGNCQGSCSIFRLISSHSGCRGNAATTLTQGDFGDWHSQPVDIAGKCTKPGSALADSGGTSTTPRAASWWDQWWDHGR